MDPTRFTRLEATAWRIDPHGSMRVPGITYAHEDLICTMDNKVYE
jgi:tRNA-splicing ligase RtcB (3'-phosphate/5'-hydroxy nucleic acid ligase)